MTKKREEWADILKGLGILMVMFGHTNLPNEILTYIYTFHVPIFFVISGYFFDFNRYPKFKGFLKVKFMSLVIPYFSMSFLCFCFYIIFSKFAHNFANNPLVYLLGIIVGIRESEWMTVNNTLWFVQALFGACILQWLILKISKKTKLAVWLGVLCSFIGYFFSVKVNIKLPWSLDAAFVAIIFMMIGYGFKYYGVIDKVCNFKCALLNFLLTIVVVVLNGMVDMYQAIYGFFPLYVLGGVTGTLFLLYISKLIKKSVILQYLGQNTFVFLAFHSYVVYSVLNRICNKLFLLPKNSVQMILLGIGYVIISVIVLLPITAIINKFTPILIGKKRKGM